MKTKLTFAALVLTGLLVSNCKSQTGKKENSVVSNQTISVRSNKQIIEDYQRLFSFENYSKNQLPNGWSQYYTGRTGEKPNWLINDDNGNLVLAQRTKDNPNYHFNLIVFDSIQAINMELRVKLKGISGHKDQGGGLVWRFTDADNYYVVRANPLEDNVVLYKVVNGKRSDLAVLGKGRTYGVNVKALGKDWNTLAIRVVDDLFSVYLNTKEIFQVSDKTFRDSGKIGLWTKADAVTYFDDFEVIVFK